MSQALCSGPGGLYRGDSATAWALGESEALKHLIVGAEQRNYLRQTPRTLSPSPRLIFSTVLVAAEVTGRLLAHALSPLLPCEHRECGGPGR